MKYTIRGHELFDLNPEFTSDLEKVVSTLFDTGVSFPDFNAYEVAVTMMHGIKKDDGDVDPKSPWLKARFRFDGKTRIDSLQGVLLELRDGDSAYIQLAEDTPEIAKEAMPIKYDSGTFWDMNMKHIRGRTAVSMHLDRGEAYDTLKLNLSRGTKLTFIYKAGTFIGFEMNESTGNGIKRTNYVLPDVDPSTYVASFAECHATRKDVVYNEGLCGDVKSMISGQTINYKQPERKPVELTDAVKGDQYIVLLNATSREQANRVYDAMKDALGDFHNVKPAVDIDLGQLSKDMGAKVTMPLPPSLSVDMKQDNNGSPNFYGFTLTTVSTGTFNTQNDMRDFITGALLGIKSKEKTANIELL